MPTAAIVAPMAGLIALLAVMPSAVEAKPLIMTPTQLDTVTAGGVYVDVAAWAAALGENASAVTQTRTDVNAHGALQTGFGIGYSEAAACCGPTSKISLGTFVSGAGDRVNGGSNTIVSHADPLTLGIAVGWIAVVSSPSRAALIKALGRPDGRAGPGS